MSWCSLQTIFSVLIARTTVPLLVYQSTCILLRERFSPLAKTDAHSFQHDCLLRSASAIRVRGCVRSKWWRLPTRRPQPISAQIKPLSLPSFVLNFPHPTTTDSSNQSRYPPARPPIYFNKTCLLATVEGRAGPHRPAICEVMKLQVNLDFADVRS